MYSLINAMTAISETSFSIVDTNMTAAHFSSISVVSNIRP